MHNIKRPELIQSHLQVHLTISLCVRCRDIEHVGSLESNSNLFHALQTSQVLNVSTYGQLKHELIVL